MIYPSFVSVNLKSIRQEIVVFKTCIFNSNETLFKEQNVSILELVFMGLVSKHCIENTEIIHTKTVSRLLVDRRTLHNILTLLTCVTYYKKMHTNWTEVNIRTLSMINVKFIFFLHK